MKTNAKAFSCSDAGTVTGSGATGGQTSLPLPLASRLGGEVDGGAAREDADVGALISIFKNRVNAWHCRVAHTAPTLHHLTDSHQQSPGSNLQPTKRYQGLRCTRLILIAVVRLQQQGVNSYHEEAR